MTTTEKMNRLAELLKGRIVENTVVVSGRFDEVRAERISERNGCTFRYLTRKQWSKCGGGWSPFNEVTATVFTFGAA
jgi:hypothetical protein